MVLHTLQPSLNGGELAPALRHRVDLQKFSTCVKTAENFFAKPEGGLSNRAGTEMLAKAKAGLVRLIPFEFDNDNTYMLEIGPEYIRFYTPNGQILDEDGNPYEIATPFGAESIWKIRARQLADVMYIAWGGTPKTLTRYDHADWRLEDYDFKNGPLELFKDGRKGAFSRIDNNSYLETSVDNPFSEGDFFKKYQINAYFPSQVLSQKITSATVSNKVSETVFYSQGNVTILTKGSWAGTIYLEESEDGKNGWKRTKSFSSPDASAGNNFEYVKNYTNNPKFLRMNCVDLMTFTDSGLKLDMTADGFYKQVNFTITGQVSATKYEIALLDDIISILDYVQGITYNGRVEITQIECPYGSGNSLNVWRLEVWLDGVKKGDKQQIGWEGMDGRGWGYTWTNFLKTVFGDDLTFYNYDSINFGVVCEQNQELYEGKTLTIKLTRTGADGAVKPDGSETEAAVFTSREAIAAAGSEEIKYFVWNEDYPTDVLLYQDRVGWSTKQRLDFSKIGLYNDFGVSDPVSDDDAVSVTLVDQKINQITAAAVAGKLVVFTSSGNHTHNQVTMTPSTATFDKDSDEGAGFVDPAVARGNILYVSPTRSSVHDYQYDYQVDGYRGNDITLMAAHLFKNQKIKEMAFQAEPDNLLWVVLESGELLCCTYLKQENVLAWTHMKTAGKVLSASVLYDGNHQNLYLSVERATGTFVEKMPVRLISYEPKEQFFVDCGRTYRGEPATVIAGLDYLEGQEVAVLADGMALPRKTVQNGRIALDYPASVVHVGLPYESRVVSLSADISLEDGTMAARKKRIVGATVFFIDTVGGWMGTEGFVLDPVERPRPKKFNEPVPLRDFDQYRALAGVHNYAPSLVVKQSDPLPMTITGWTFKIAPGG